MRIVLGTRGSDLARAQTLMAETALRREFPELEIAIEIIRTSGDEKGSASFQLAGSEKVQAVSLRSLAGRKGLFTAEIEQTLLDGRIDVAVHSAKDLPSEMTAGLEVCAALPRAAVEDVFVSRKGGGLEAVPTAATVATGSVRRQFQLRRLRPDLEVVDLRGNVPTRLRKLSANDWSGIILARAGLERLGYDCGSGLLKFEDVELHAAILSTQSFLPAGGQGIVALQARADHAAAKRALAAINHEETFRCLQAEREFLRLLQGDCGTPVGVIAEGRGDMMTMHAELFGEAGEEPRSAVAEGSEPLALAAKLLELING